jgi:2-desacetyl-2-hydroxyethyl bacteriochlorophyllide A dehydrogenase
MESRYVEFPEEGVVELKTKEVPEGDLGPYEVLLRTESSLVSAGTELNRLHNTLGDATYPMGTGYACVGRILKKGEAVDDFEEGDRVFYAGNHAEIQRFQHAQDHQWGRLYPVPDDVEPEQAPYCCLAQIAYIGPMLTELALGDTVAVFGLGVIGNLAAQFYQLMGARVIGLDPVTKRTELARRVGIQEVVGVEPKKQVMAIQEMTGGHGAQVTVDAVGHSGVIENAVQATDLFGQVILLGTPRASYETDMTRTLHQVHMQGITMRGAHMWCIPAMEVRGPRHNVAKQYAMAFNLIQQEKLQVDPLRSHFVKPERAPEMYHGLWEERDNYWGVVFDWS